MRRLLSIALTSITISLALAGCADGTLDDGRMDMMTTPTDYRIAWKGDTASYTVAENGERRLQVQVLQPDGLPAPGITVEYSIPDAGTGGASLSTPVATTDAEGCAEVIVRAGTEAMFSLIANAKEAGDARATINVSRNTFTDLRYTVTIDPTWDGLAPTAIFGAVYTNITCQDVVDRPMTSTHDLAKVTAGTARSIPNLPLGGMVAIFAFAQDGWGNKVSQKCIDVTLTDMPHEATIILTQDDSSITGRYRTEIYEADFLSSLPGVIRTTIDVLAGLSRAPATTIFGLVEDFTGWTLPGSLAEVGLALADDFIADWLRDILPDWVGDVLTTAERLEEALSNMTIIGTITIDEPNELGIIEGRHDVTSVAVPIDGELRRENISAGTGISMQYDPETQMLTIEEHYLELPISSVVGPAIDIVVETVDPTADDLGDLLTKNIDCERGWWSEGGSFRSLACRGIIVSLNFVGDQIDTGIDLLLGYDRVKVDAMTEMVDANMNLQADIMDDGPANLVWESTMGFAGDLQFDGKLKGEIEDDTAPNGDAVYTELEPMFAGLQ